MAEINKVVAHFRDDRLLKGTTQDFMPNRAFFHVLPAAGGPAEQVMCKDLKALFFVRSLEGDKSHVAPRGFGASGGAGAGGKKIAVRFKDGELLCGYALSYTTDRPGFFILPADTQGNNLRVYVIRSATFAVKLGAEAEAMAREDLGRAA